MDRKGHQRWNEEMARLYDPDAFITRTGFLIRWVEGRRLGLTHAALEAAMAGRVLDLGCGAGNLLERMMGERAVGLDLSDVLLAQARAKLAGRGGLPLIQGDAERLPFRDNTFDGIACSEVVEHVLDPRAVFAEIRRVAKPGARLVLTIPNEELINSVKRVIVALGLKKWVAGTYNMSDNMLDAWHKRDVTPGWAVRECAEGFALESVQAVPFPVAAFHRVMTFRVKK